jgi:hypothetical protein
MTRGLGAVLGGAVTEREYSTVSFQPASNRLDIIDRREYLKNSYVFISLTIQAVKIQS